MIQASDFETQQTFSVVDMVSKNPAVFGQLVEAIKDPQNPHGAVILFLHENKNNIVAFNPLLWPGGFDITKIRYAEVYDHFKIIAGMM